VSEAVPQPGGDSDERRSPPSPAAERWLAETDAEAQCGDLWKYPPIREQLAEHYERVGLAE
jgi:hypothetical protein